jgi:hypothetical protein
MVIHQRKDKVLVVVHPLVVGDKENFVVEMNLAASNSMTH